MIPRRLSKVNHRKHGIEELLGIRVLGGDDVQNEDLTLSVFDLKVLRVAKEFDRWIVQ